MMTSLAASVLTWAAVNAGPLTRRAVEPQISPATGSTNVNPDTQLSITFSAPPTIGNSGLVQIFDAATNALVDHLDLSVPSSPSPYGNGSTKANYTDTKIYGM